MHNPLKILFLAAEADPFIKVGGLGDVVGSLPNALLALNDNLDVRLVIPFHTSIRTDNFDLHREIFFTIPRAGVSVPVQVFHTEQRGLSVYFISGAPFTQSSNVYDTDAGLDGEKYVFFSMAALELARQLNWRPDIVHANDWHGCAALYGIRRMQSDPFWHGVKTLLSVHNLGYMGAGSEAALTAYGLPPLNDPDLPWWGQQVPMPLGLWSADEIVAVSPTYAEEIQTSDYGCGLESFLRSKHERVSGIVNGIDVVLWDPRSDSVLARNFSVDQLAMRAENKKLLQTQVGLEVSQSIPLLAMVTRLDQQKGADIAFSALRQIADIEWQAVLLGSGNPDLEDAARRLESDFPNRVRAVLRFDGKLARQIYGGADMLMMPSRYEPCGLAQMIAMRYGTVPVARVTGGLSDTIDQEVTGFLFKDASPTAMAEALRLAMLKFKSKDVWQGFQKAGMSKDFSWNLSAHQYDDLYLSLSSRKP